MSSIGFGAHYVVFVMSDAHAIADVDIDTYVFGIFCQDHLIFTSNKKKLIIVLQDEDIFGVKEAILVKCLCCILWTFVVTL